MPSRNPNRGSVPSQGDGYPYNTEKMTEELKVKLNYDSFYESYISKTTPSIDIPDPENLELKFVYNFFTPDERKNRFVSNNQQIITLSSNQTNDVMFQQATDRLPRVVKLNFKPVENFGNTEINRNDLANINIQSNLNKLIIEGSTSNNHMQGFELIDNLSDLRFYYALKTTLDLQDVVGENSNTSKANRLADLLNSDDSVSSPNEKKLILDVLGNMQPQGVQSLDTDSIQKQIGSDLASNQSFSIKFNKVLFEKISKSATLNSTSIFEDEFRALANASQSITSTARSNTDPDSLQNDTDLTVLPISTSPVGDSPNMNDLMSRYPKITLIGYIIQRKEISNSGKPVNLDPIFVENIKTKQITDSNVRYGYTYIYKIRAVAVIETVALQTQSNTNFTQPVIVKFLIASEGAEQSISCVEKTPPPPPVNLNFRMHHKFLKPIITWNFPINPTRDIKKFQVFKRNSINEGFALLREFDFDNSIIKSEFFERVPPSKSSKSLHPVLSFIDRDFELGSSPIYAIASVDAHGMTSGYSAQFQIRYDRYANKIMKTLISKSGATKPYPNIYLNVDTFKDSMKSSGFSKMTVVFDPEYYVVTKTENPDTNNANEIDLKLIAISNNQPTYKLQVINTDYQESEVLNISIKDNTGPPQQLPAAALNLENLSFEFGN